MRKAELGTSILSLDFPFEIKKKNFLYFKGKNITLL